MWPLHVSCKHIIIHTTISQREREREGGREGGRERLLTRVHARAAQCRVWQFNNVVIIKFEWRHPVNCELWTMIVEFKGPTVEQPRAEPMHRRSWYGWRWPAEFWWAAGRLGRQRVVISTFDEGVSVAGRSRPLRLATKANTEQPVQRFKAFVSLRLQERKRGLAWDQVT